jgi:GNAT superfamily N-acetyltransferase
MNIVVITAEQTYPLRHQVLWPQYAIDFVKVPEDANGQHFAVETDGQLVSVISLFVEGKLARFRKFATHPAFQRQGVGSALLTHVMDVAATQHAESIWCDARLEAVAFYGRWGMQQQGEVFYKGEVPYVRMQKWFTALSE